MRRHSVGVRVAGTGVVSPLGFDGRSTWQGICAGVSGVRTVKGIDLDGLHVRIAGEVDVPDGPYHSWLLRREVEGRRLRFGLTALEEALADAELDLAELRRVPLGVFTGCEKEETEDLFYERGSEDAQGEEVELRQLRFTASRYADGLATTIAEAIGNVRFSLNYAMACSASAVAIAQAVRWLRRGHIERALVIGADTPISTGTANGFHMLGALSANNDNPAMASRPFDVSRDGFVLAEGAGAMVLESEALWQRRKRARSACVLRGFGMTNNKYHMTKTPPDGAEAARAMRLAVEDAGVEAAEIDYVNAHATSTDVGDASEARAISAVLGTNTPVSSTKGMTGHLVAASGIVEAIFCVYALRDQLLPPSTNLERQDEDCAINVVANTVRPAQIRHAMSNSFGFGGANVSIVLER